MSLNKLLLNENYDDIYKIHITKYSKTKIYNIIMLHQLIHDITPELYNILCYIILNFTDMNSTMDWNNIDELPDAIEIYEDENNITRLSNLIKTYIGFQIIN